MKVVLSGPIKGVSKSHALWVEDGATSVPIVFLRKPKWVTNNDAWARFIRGAFAAIDAEGQTALDEMLESAVGKIDRMRAENERLRAERDALAAALEAAQMGLRREESDHERTIDQRDAAEDALSRMFQAVTGRPAEWSSAWGYVDAIEEVEEHVAALAALAAMAARGGEDDAWCAECGVKLENVRPGKHQHPTCSQAQPLTDEALLRQALEALEFEAGGWEYPPPKTTAAIAALRERLGEKEQR